MRRRKIAFGYWKKSRITGRDSDCGIAEQQLEARRALLVPVTGEAQTLLLI
jgi:hypothetical protein